MSAADRPIRSGLTALAGAAMFVGAPVGVGLLVAGGWFPTIAGAALSWGVILRLRKDQRRRWQR
jgi:hypothetical protein